MTPAIELDAAIASEPMPAGTPFGSDLVLVEHLRRGRDLDVYDAWSQARGTSVVVKMVRPDRRGRVRTVARLVREGEMLARLTHPHIVRCYETCMAPLPALVLETLGGRTLSALLDDEELTAPEIAFLGLHLAAAVRYLHRHDVLHLDLKPSNVIETGGRAILLDLSVARSPGHAPPGVGTWGYQAPEQVTGGVLGPPADVWGLGVTLYEAATGIPAFDDPLPDEESEGASTGLSSTGSDWSSEPAGGWNRPAPQLIASPQPLAELRSLPEPLVGLVTDCLHRDAARRPVVDDVLARLERIAGIPPAERRFT